MGERSLPFEIPAAEMRIEFLRSSGPGGQNVNKVETAVRLRFDVAASPTLPEELKQRLLALAGRRATEAGEILIVARRHRTQARNREEAIARLAELVERAARPRPRRRPTRPGAAARARRLSAKSQRAGVKRQRRPPRPED